MKSEENMRHDLILELQARVECAWDAQDAERWEEMRSLIHEVQGLIDAMRLTGVFTPVELDCWDGIRETLSMDWLDGTAGGSVWAVEQDVMA